MKTANRNRTDRTECVSYKREQPFLAGILNGGSTRLAANARRASLRVRALITRPGLYAPPRRWETIAPPQHPHHKRAFDDDDDDAAAPSRVR